MEERRDEKGRKEEKFESYSDTASPDTAVTAVASAASWDTNAGGDAAEVDATASNARHTAVSAILNSGKWGQSLQREEARKYQGQRRIDCTQLCCIDKGQKRYQ